MAFLKLNWNLPGANELTSNDNSIRTDMIKNLL